MSVYYGTTQQFNHALTSNIFYGGHHTMISGSSNPCDIIIKTSNTSSSQTNIKINYTIIVIG